MVRTAVIGLAALALSEASVAAPTWAEKVGSAQWIVDTCSSNATNESLVCLSYVRGILDGQAFIEAYHSAAGLICIPAGFSIEQARRVIAKYGADHPEELNLDAGSITTLALAQAFPCKKN